MQHKKKVWLFWFCLGFFILAVDIFSKYLVVKFIPQAKVYHWQYPYGGIPVFKNFLGIEFSIIHATNTGAAWSLFMNLQIPLLIFRIILMIAMAFYLFYKPHSCYFIPLIVTLAGATGNVIDYFIYGHVIDMFHFVFWGWDFPVFNIADSAITCGILGLCYVAEVRSLRTRDKRG